MKMVQLTDAVKIMDNGRIDLPTYQVVEVIGERKAKISVPDDEVDIANGTIKLSKNKIRQKYRGQQRWDRPDIGDDL